MFFKNFVVLSLNSSLLFLFILFLIVFVVFDVFLKNIKNSPEKIIKNLLKKAGIKINGSGPSDPQIHDGNFYSRVFKNESLGLGESYMENLWDCYRLDQFFCEILRAKLDRQVWRNPYILLNIAFKIILNTIFNRGKKSKALEKGLHYNFGNDLFQAMLDKRMVYTCGYWKNANNLDEAQEAKLDLVCKKIRLKEGQKILDIGCGWGSFAKYAAEKYDAEVIGITVSEEQVKLGKELCKGLPVEIRLQDYRGIDEKFDHIVSLGMFEHVGYKNYKTYMKKVWSLLSDSGLFLLHTIGGNRSVKFTNPWTGKYIFPNSMIPSIKQISGAVEGLFVIEDIHNFGADYDKTLMAWHQNFEDNWNKIKSNYDERFYRMWKYFLLSCAGSFRARRDQLWQIVLSKKGVPGGYKSIR